MAAIHYRLIARSCPTCCSDGLPLAGTVFTDAVGEVTCYHCRRYIERHMLMPRGEFPAVPEFETVQNKAVRCPVCGQVTTPPQFPTAETPRLHVAMACDCWRAGAILVYREDAP